MTWATHGVPFLAAVEDGPLSATQFHPEKSGDAGAAVAQQLGRERLSDVSLILLPAVDVVEGKAVRLVQGEAGSETDYGSALEAALAWQRDGAAWVHLVDLDAAFGRGSNRELLAEVVGKLDVAGRVVRRYSRRRVVAAALGTGCARVNLGTAALENPQWCRKVDRRAWRQGRGRPGRANRRRRAQVARPRLGDRRRRPMAGAGTP